MREAYFTKNLVPVSMDEDWSLCVKQVPSGVSNDRIAVYLSQLLEPPRYSTYAELVVLAKRQVKPKK